MAGRHFSFGGSTPEYALRINPERYSPWSLGPPTPQILNLTFGEPPCGIGGGQHKNCGFGLRAFWVSCLRPQLQSQQCVAFAAVEPPKQKPKLKITNLLAVLNRDYRAPITIPMKDCWFRGNIPTLTPEAFASAGDWPRWGSRVGVVDRLGQG